MIDENYNISIAGTEYNGKIYDSNDKTPITPSSDNTPLPYHKSITYTFNPAVDTLYNEILLDSVSPYPSPEEETKPFEEETKPFEEETNPVEEETKPVEEETKPFEEEIKEETVEETVEEIVDKNENSPDEIVDMIQEGGQTTTINTTPPTNRTETFDDNQIQRAATVARLGAAENTRSIRRDAGLIHDDYRSNCSSEESCEQFRNVVGDQLNSAARTNLQYTSPGGPVRGTPPFPGPCWRRDGNGPLTEYPAGSDECATTFVVSGGKTRLSRRSGKKNSSPSRMSRRTRRSRRSTRKAGRKGRRATRRSRK